METDVSGPADSNDPTRVAGGVVIGDDGLARCPWAVASPLLRHYHDHEWGRIVRGEQGLFERVSLEGFQAGLSWAIVLAKREAFRDAFADFDPDAVAAFSDADLEAILGRGDIIRNRAKIEATRSNAQAVLELRADGGLDRLIWSHRPEDSPRPVVAGDVPTRTVGSEALARDLKRRGFRFIGPTSAFALTEAIGMVDTHLLACHRRGRGANPETEDHPATGTTDD